MDTQPIPPGYSTITPYIATNGASQFLHFLEAVFDAKIISRIDGPNGAIMNAEVKIGTSFLMVGEGATGYGSRAATLYLYVENADELYKRAIKFGAKSLMAPADQFYGDRTCGVEDAFGNHWWIATHLEDVSREEVRRRAALRKPEPMPPPPKQKKDDEANDAEKNPHAH